MSPATHYADLLRQAVVAGIPIRMEPALKILQKFLRILRLSVGTVLIQNNGVFCISACSV